MKKNLLVILYLLIVSSNSLAIKLPAPSAYDPRVREINYNARDVVQLNAVVGVATHIVLEEAEEYITHAFGDALAWEFANVDHHYFIKPKEQNADSNLTIVTNKRIYYFRLNYYDNKESKAMYGVSFTYPDSLKEQKQKEIKDKAFQQNVSRAGYNLAYTMAGDLEIAPINVWDNNEFTYFKFPGNRDLPGIYMVDFNGDESIANRNSFGAANDIVIVHKVNHKWILRLGNRALAIYNEDYDAIGVSNTSKTASPIIKRVIKEIK